MTDVEILKKAGVYDVEKMRTILLMNAEFNMNNKKLGQDMMNHAEKHGALAREQYRSRQNHQYHGSPEADPTRLSTLRKRCKILLRPNCTQYCYLVYALAGHAKEPNPFHVHDIAERISQD
jgi:hypothetical protein